MADKIPKLTKHYTRNGKYKKKTRDFVKQWREEKRQAFKESHKKKIKCPECNKELPVTYPKFVDDGKEICFECGTDKINYEKAMMEVEKFKKKKEEKEYGYFLWRNEQC